MIQATYYGITKRNKQVIIRRITLRYIAIQSITNKTIA